MKMTPERAREIRLNILSWETSKPKPYPLITTAENMEIMKILKTMPDNASYYDAILRIEKGE
jgi:hypothetical protein